MSRADQREIIHDHQPPEVTVQVSEKKIMKGKNYFWCMAIFMLICDHFDDVK